MTLPDTERFRLLNGPYSAPLCKIGGWLTCKIRGRVRVVKMSDGPVPWPMVKVPGPRPPAFALCGDLIEAVRQESTLALQHHWGVKTSTVWRWRKALGVDQNNQGTLRLRSKWWTDGGVGEAARPGREATYHCPKRIAKSAASRRGKSRPPRATKGTRKADRGRKLSAVTQQRVRGGQRRPTGAHPPYVPPPPLSVEQVLAWADHHLAEAGQYPRIFSGAVRAHPVENWRKIDNAFRYGLRGLPGDTSLAQFLAEHRGKRNPSDLPPLDEEQVLAWADAHRMRMGRWPVENDQEVADAPGEVWKNIDAALRQGLRGFPAGGSLAKLIARRRGVRNKASTPRLTALQIIAWAKRYRKENGRWPTRSSGAIDGVADETWAKVEHALQGACRGLPRYSSLGRLFEEVAKPEKA